MCDSKCDYGVDFNMFHESFHFLQFALVYMMKFFLLILC